MTPQAANLLVACILVGLVLAYGMDLWRAYQQDSEDWDDLAILHGLPTLGIAVVLCLFLWLYELPGRVRRAAGTVCCLGLALLVSAILGPRRVRETWRVIQDERKADQ